MNHWTLLFYNYFGIRQIANILIFVLFPVTFTFSQSRISKSEKQIATIDSTFRKYENEGYNTKERQKYIYHFIDRERIPIQEIAKSLEKDSIEVIHIYNQNRRWHVRAFENAIYSRQSMFEKEKDFRWKMYIYKVDQYRGFSIAEPDIDYSKISSDQFYAFLRSLDDDDLFNVGLRLDKTKDYQKSMLAFDELIKREFKLDTSHLMFGNALVGIHEYVKGIEQWEEATKINPDYLQAHMQLGNIFYENSHWKKAHLHFKEADRVKPNDDEILYHLARSLIKIERYNEAYTTIRRAVKINPKNIYAKGVLKSLKRPEYRKLRKLFPDK